MTHQRTANGPHRTKRFLPISFAFALLAAIAPAASRADQSPPPNLVKLPNGDYTVPLRELAGSGVSGTATFHSLTPTKTLVTVYAYGALARQHSFTLHSGKGCSQLGMRGAQNLKPALTGEPSQTIVSLPITTISSNYVVAAHDATTRNQYAEACGHF
jgi:hypothetical protein